MKKGFTIAEMTGTVIILCIIALIAFPPLLNLVKKTESDLEDKNKELVINAATSYITRNINDYPKVENSIYYISVEDLVKDDLLTNTLIENTSLKLDSCVKVNVNNDKYEYDVEINCSRGE